MLQRIHRSPQIIYLGLATALRGLRDNIRYVVWQPFALSLGLSVKDIGALESLMELSRIILQPVIGAASDVYGRKPFLILRDLLVVFAGVFFIFAKSWLYVTFGMVLIGLGYGIIPVWTSIVAESAEKGQIGWLYGILGSVYMTCGLVGTLSAGWLAETVGYRMVFIVFVIASTLSLIVTTLKIEETHTPSKLEFGVGKAVTSMLDSFRPQRYLWGYYIAMSVDLLAFSIGWRLINGLLVDAFGFTPGQIAIISAFQTGTMAFSQILIGSRVDKYGSRVYLTVSQIISGILIAALILRPTYLVAIASNVLMGVAAALWSPAEQSWVANNVDPSERAKSIGGYSTFRGLVALPGPFIGGLIYDRYGYNAPMLVNFVLLVVDILLLWFLIKDNAREEAGLVNDS
jgi:DHA1 family multidrug resistance protein-like MFS transporter